MQCEQHVTMLSGALWLVWWSKMGWGLTWPWPGGRYDRKSCPGYVEHESPRSRSKMRFRGLLVPSGPVVCRLTTSMRNWDWDWVVNLPIIDLHVPGIRIGSTWEWIESRTKNSSPDLETDTKISVWWNNWRTLTRFSIRPKQRRECKYLTIFDITPKKSSSVIFLVAALLRHAKSNRLLCGVPSSHQRRVRFQSRANNVTETLRAGTSNRNANIIFHRRSCRVPFFSAMVWWLYCS